MLKAFFSLPLLCLILTTLTLRVEINNIHVGYRNVYEGTPQLHEHYLILHNYQLTKQELTSDDIPFIQTQQEQVGIDMNQLVKQF